MFQKKDVEKINTYFVFNAFFSENFVVYEIMWKNYRIERQARCVHIIRRMRDSYLITKATNTH